MDTSQQNYVKKLNINGSPLEVKIGDIFEEGELRVINFNEYFDTVVDDKLIAKSSLNGRYIENHVTDVAVLDKAITDDTHLAEMKQNENSSRKSGKKYSTNSAQSMLLMIIY